MGVLTGHKDRIQLVHHGGQRGLIDVDAATTPLPSMDKDFEISGSSVANGNCTYNVEEGLTLTTSSTQADQVAMLPITAGDDFSLWREVTWGTDREVDWECVMLTDTLTSVMIIVAGLLLTFPATFVEGDDADRVVFNYLEGTDTNWQIAINRGSADVTVDTGVPVSASSRYHFRIRIDKARRAHCYINGREVYVSVPLADAINLLPCLAVEEGDTDPGVIHYVSMSISRALGA